jgi:hypothetical protein
MKLSVCAAVLPLASLARPVLAGEPNTLPKTATPSIAIVPKVDRQKQQVTQGVMQLTVAKGRQKGDGLTPRKQPGIRGQMQEFTTGLAGFKFVTAGGQELDEKAGWGRLKGGQAIVVTSDLRGVDPIFCRVLANDALMLVPAVAEPADPGAGA